MTECHIHGDGRSERDPADHAPIDVEMIEEGDDVIGETRDRQSLGVAERMRLAVRTEVEREQANSGRRAVDGARLTRVAAEAVLEDERQTAPFVAIVETQSLAVKSRHDRFSDGVRECR